MSNKTPYEAPQVNTLGSLTGRTGFFGPENVTDVYFGPDGEEQIGEGLGSQDGIIEPK